MNHSPKRSSGVVRALAVAVAFAAIVTTGRAAPRLPTDDAEVVERLPARLTATRTLVQLGRGATRDPREAAARARALLVDARDRGDPRYAGYALAALAPWKTDPATPSELVILRATIAQYQHDFAGAQTLLDGVVAREPTNAQALLTLATIARVQGRYDASDAACRRVPVGLYAAACLAENDALRGRFDEARKVLAALLGASLGPGSEQTRRWLLTTRAELEARAGDVDAAQAAFDAASRLGRDSYLALDRADALLERGRADDARALMEGEPRPYGDGVLLRLAIAAAATKASDAPGLADELRERFAASLDRGDAISIHGREYARYLDVVAGRPAEAVTVARDNLRAQKEPADFLVMARAARSANDRVASKEVRDAATAIGLVDRRLDALTR